MSTWISQAVLKGATGATGGVFGSAIADFGAADNGGADAMSVTVTVSAPWVSATSYPIVKLVSGADHLDADDLTSEEIYALVTNVVNGVSFDIEVFAPNGTQGQWLVNWGAAVTGSTPPLHATSHQAGGTDPITALPVSVLANATSSAPGLLNTVSGLSTDFIDGTNNPQHISNIVPSGTIWETAASAAPSGWLLCDGTSYATATYPALFAAIAYTFGGSGANFNVPDARGRVTVGVGTGSGLTARALAATGGEETHLLTTPEMPAHTHSTTYTGVSVAAGATGINSSPGATGNVTGSTGGGGAHNTMQPFIAFNKMIKT